ncbi:hypothetical protein [Agrobacterium pusense]|uniref:hypothetical protein n=1 Tax=Agrobacterium pusense TaxID=648995 RepID=UPI000ECC5238|nr:hypothetical protein [Agrobacterium sp.]
MTDRNATAAEVRKLYKDQGHTVRIDREGRVEFKRDGEGSWLEGRWVSEYRVDEEAGVYLR